MTYYNLSDPHQFRIAVTFTNGRTVAAMAPGHLGVCLDDHECAKDIVSFRRNMVFMGSPLVVPEDSIVYLVTDAKESYNRHKQADHLIISKNSKFNVVPINETPILVFQEEHKRLLIRSVIGESEGNNIWSPEPFSLESFYITTLIKDKDVPMTQFTRWYGMEDMIRLQSLAEVKPVFKDKPYGPRILNQMNDYNIRNSKAYRYFAN